jgi:hypothetical protein
MRDDMYKMIGEVSIPDDQKEEFNSLVLQILYKCGIRKTDQMTIGGKNITVVKMPEPDENGILHFDYSIFEKKKRDTSTYNMHTCELISQDRGYNEYGLAMNMIMALQEAYSKTVCCMVTDDEPTRSDIYASIIYNLTGKKLLFPNRGKTFEIMQLFRKELNNNVSEILLENMPQKFTQMDIRQSLICWVLNCEEESSDDDTSDVTKKNLKFMTTGALVHYLSKIFTHLFENDGKEKVYEYLKTLLISKYDDRQVMAQDNSDYGMIAETSLDDLPQNIILAYSRAAKEDFWELWNDFQKDAYTDLPPIPLKPKPELEEKDYNWTPPFYKLIYRDYQDEFMEFWDDADMLFSDKIKTSIQKWTDAYRMISSEKIQDMDTEAFLADLISDLYEIWNGRYVDQSFVDEFMQNRDRAEYKKALVVMRNFMDSETVYFPELTKKQAEKFVIWNYLETDDVIAMCAFQSLMINHRHRMELFGF